MTELEHAPFGRGGEALSIVIQGAVSAPMLDELHQTVSCLRALVPDAEIILSTWQGSPTAIESIGLDRVVTSADPGSLRSVRPTGEFPNNVNRQIVSTSAGLLVASRKYAVKLRTDASFTSLGFLDLYKKYAINTDREKIVVCAFFTVDPRMFEHLPFHISDWFQFGPTERLRRYWGCDLMSDDDAVYYKSRPYASGSTYFDRRFACRLATEQFLAVSYAASLGYEVPRFHNDARQEVLTAFDEFLGHEVIVAEPHQLGLVFDKYAWVGRSGFQYYNCITFLDWLKLFALRQPSHLTDEETEAVSRRLTRKRTMRRWFEAARPIWWLFDTPVARRTVNKFIRKAMMRSEAAR